MKVWDTKWLTITQEKYSFAFDQVQVYLLKDFEILSAKMYYEIQKCKNATKKQNKIKKNKNKKNCPQNVHWGCKEQTNKYISNRVYSPSGFPILLPYTTYYTEIYLEYSFVV